MGRVVHAVEAAMAAMGVRDCGPAGAPAAAD